MTQTLQQALLKAGLITQDKLKKAEADKKAAERAARFPKKEERHAPPPPRKKDLSNKSERGSAAPASRRDADRSARSDRENQMRGPGRERDRSPGFIEGKHHHHIRTQCEACGRPSPDVEYYEHKNRALDKYWLCVRCADDNNILDDFRQTMQSSQAQKGIFQRGYGPTKIFRRKL